MSIRGQGYIRSQWVQDTMKFEGKGLRDIEERDVGSDRVQCWISSSLRSTKSTVVVSVGQSKAAVKTRLGQSATTGPVFNGRLSLHGLISSDPGNKKWPNLPSKQEAIGVRLKSGDGEGGQGGPEPRNAGPIAALAQTSRQRTAQLATNNFLRFNDNIEFARWTRALVRCEDKRMKELGRSKMKRVLRRKRWRVQW